MKQIVLKNNRAVCSTTEWRFAEEITIMKKLYLQIVVVVEGLYLLLDLFNNHYANNLYYRGGSFELFKWLTLPLSMLCLSFLISIPLALIIQRNVKFRAATLLALLTSLVVCIAYMKYNETLCLALTPLNYICVAAGSAAANYVIRKGERKDES